MPLLRTVTQPLAVLLATAVLAGSADAAAADVPDRVRGTGAVQVTGAPLVHAFDLGVAGDAVTGHWEVAATTDRPVPFDGVLAPDGPVDATLARALAVHYGEVDADGEVRAWHAAGTLADPVAYGDAVEQPPVVGRDRPTPIPVRVSLPDPDLVVGEPGEVLAVEATFRVSYLADDADQPGAGDGGAAEADGLRPDVVRPDGLAVTGAAPGPIALLVALAVLVGAALRRRARAVGPLAAARPDAVGDRVR